MYVYSSVTAEIADVPVTKEVEFALLDMDPLCRALKENARCWVTSLGKLLNDSARENLTKLTTKLEVCGACMHVHTLVILTVHIRLLVCKTLPNKYVFQNMVIGHTILKFLH